MFCLGRHLKCIKRHFTSSWKILADFEFDGRKRVVVKRKSWRLLGNRYKKSVLERQSFSEEEMGRASPIYKKASTNCVKFFRIKYSSMEIAKNLNISLQHIISTISIKIQRIWRNRSNLSPRHESVYGLRNTSRNLWTQFTVPFTYSSYSSTMQRRSHLWIIQKHCCLLLAKLIWNGTR